MGGARGKKSVASARPDTNLQIAGVLSDLASVQSSTQSEKAYKRAAMTILQLDEPLDALKQPDDTLPKIQNIGPSSLRVITEVLETGASPTVERAIAASGRMRDVEENRALRQHFLSRAQVLAALRNSRLAGPTLEDYQGDLQMHSTYSDGSQSLDTIVQTGIARGYAYSAVTDHSYGLPVAGGVTMEALARQHEEMDRLNARYADRYRLLKGIEANIRGDGTLDMTPDELRRVELVVAAPHSGLRSRGDQTGRMVTAVNTRGVHILGHPRGRKYGARPGIVADWGKVFRAAVRVGVAIEIDGDPNRQDVDYELAQEALAVGCIFALDGDAHATDEWPYAETSIAHARLAGIPRDRIINCWPLATLLDWAAWRAS
jgi:histidinol phosphatase-like PHP family hydrolase